ncbi:MAG: hypothetical protein JNK02_08055 [Planctomycetes bacterium]|nr:hypothetical protein [Planctomycetota bacterium]
MRNGTCLLLALAASSCQLKNPTPRLDDSERGARASAQATRDGGTLAPAREPGTVAVVQTPLRELEGAPGGRVWLLELYHETLARKDELAKQLAQQDAALSATVAEAAFLRAERDAAVTRAAELEAKIGALERQSLDLAQRLVEAEIARLEAEKSALEREAALDRRKRP